MYFVMKTLLSIVFINVLFSILCFIGYKVNSHFDDKEKKNS